MRTLGLREVYLPFFRSSFSDFAGKFAKDERFKGIEKMRDREALFADFVSELRRKEKEESRNQKEKVSVFRLLWRRR